MGKCFPVIERHTGKNSIEGKPTRDGYHSHYVVTTIEGFIPEDDIYSSKEELYDEIVLGQELTALPLFLLDIDPASLSSDYNNKQDFEDTSTVNEPMQFI